MPLPAARLVELELFDLLFVDIFEDELFAVDLPGEALETFPDDRPVDEVLDFALVLRPPGDLALDDFDPVERPADDLDEDLEPDGVPPDVFDLDELLAFFPAEPLVDRFTEELVVFLPDEIFFDEELFVEVRGDPLRDVPLLLPFPDPEAATCSAADAAAPITAPPAAPASMSDTTSLALS